MHINPINPDEFLGSPNYLDRLVFCLRRRGKKYWRWTTITIRNPAKFWFDKYCLHDFIDNVYENY